MDRHIESFAPWSVEATLINEGGYNSETYGISTTDKQRRGKSFITEPELARDVLQILRREHPNVVPTTTFTSELGITYAHLRNVLNTISEAAGIYVEQISASRNAYGIVDLYRTVEGVDV